MRPVISEKHQLLILPDVARKVFRHGKPLKFRGRSCIAVPHRLDETRLLRNLGVPIPNPIRAYYSWPGSPWDAQKTTADMCTFNRRGYVLNGLGTGKTRAALYALDYLFSIGEITRALIVAPLSTLVSTWEDELLVNFPHLSVRVLHSHSKARRVKFLEEKAQVNIINTDGVSVMRTELIQHQDIDAVVLDELAMYRNGQTKRWAHMDEFLSGKRYVWGLTGAPTPNHPTDAWAQCMLLTPNTVPWSFRKFKQQTMVQVNQYLWLPKYDATETVHKAMSPAVRFELEDCDDIPPVVHEVRSVPLSKKQQKVFDEYLAMVKKEMTVASGNRLHSLTRPNEAARIGKLLQICCGWVYDDVKNTLCLNPTDRLQELAAVIQSTRRKVLVFVPYLNSIAGVVEFLRAKKFEVAEITRHTPARKRTEIFNAFQHADTPRVIVAQPKTMSHGLTLTAANVIVWYAPPNSLDTYIQANGRISRAGQKHKQAIVHLEGSAVERKVYSRLKRQEQFQGLLLEMFKDSTRSL